MKHFTLALTLFLPALAFSQCDEVMRQIPQAKIVRSECHPSMPFYSVGGGEIEVAISEQANEIYHSDYSLCNELNYARMEGRSVSLKLRCIGENETIQSFKVLWGNN